MAGIATAIGSEADPFADRLATRTGDGAAERSGAGVS